MVILIKIFDIHGMTGVLPHSPHVISSLTWTFDHLKTKEPFFFSVPLYFFTFFFAKFSFYFFC